MANVVLEHVNIRTTRFKETVAFYTEIIGLHPGDTPPGVPYPSWLYDDREVAVLHLVDVDPFDPERLRKIDNVTFSRPVEALHGTGTIDHVAFGAKNYDTLLKRVKDAGVHFKLNEVPGLRQIFVIDPNGIVIEINFRESANEKK